jgi:hypothetical protein
MFCHAQDVTSYNHQCFGWPFSGSLVNRNISAQQRAEPRGLTFMSSHKCKAPCGSATGLHSALSRNHLCTKFLLALFLKYIYIEENKHSVHLNWTALIALRHWLRSGIPIGSNVKRQFLCQLMALQYAKLLDKFVSETKLPSCERD